MQIQKITTLWPVILAYEPREKIYGANIEIFPHNHDFLTLLILHGKVFRRIHGNECLFDNCVIVSGKTDHVRGANVSYVGVRSDSGNVRSVSSGDFRSVGGGDIGNTGGGDVRRACGGDVRNGGGDVRGGIALDW